MAQATGVSSQCFLSANPSFLQFARALACAFHGQEYLWGAPALSQGTSYSADRALPLLSLPRFPPPPPLSPHLPVPWAIPQCFLPSRTPFPAVLCLGSGSALPCGARQDPAGTGHCIRLEPAVSGWGSLGLPSRSSAAPAGSPGVERS